MKVYHGSWMEIAEPDLKHSRTDVDFGKGFYTTPLREQAVKWCGKFKRRGKQGIVTTYEFDESTSSSLKILSFDSYSEEWLDFILKCRRKQDSSDYDIVMGGVANDKVFNTVELYFDHLIDKQEAIKEIIDYLKINKENIYAFGDAEVDIPMFEIAGTSICVGNGREKAKKQASYVTKPVSEDGIEYALKHFKII